MCSILGSERPHLPNGLNLHDRRLVIRPMPLIICLRGCERGLDASERLQEPLRPSWCCQKP